MSIEQHMSLLGLKVKDRVTGMKGVVESVSFDLYGCIQAVVRPEAGKDGKLGDAGWFDVSRLEIKGQKPVMEVPDFFDHGPVALGQKGPAQKPLPR